jgi:hypothetical protein
MEGSKIKLFLLGVCVIALLTGYAIYSHRSSKAKASSEMKTGVKVFTDPEELVKDLEK